MMMMSSVRRRGKEVDSITDLTTLQKVASLFIALGPHKSAGILKFFPEEHMVERLAFEIASMQKLKPEILAQIISEFYVLFEAQGYIVSGGIGYAKEILSDSFGDEVAAKIMDRLIANMQSTPFDFFNKADPSQLASSFQNENPQLVSLVLAYLKPQRSAAVLSCLSPEMQVEVASRIADMDRTNPDVLREVELILESKFSSVMTADFSVAGGVESLADILNYSDRTTEKAIMDNIEMKDPEMAEHVRELMFVFDDIYKLDNRSIQRILREVETKDLALALKGAKDEVKETVYNNMSERATAMLKDDMDYMGAVRAKDVQEKQTYIVGIIRALESAGEIQVARTQEEDNFIS
jgi:flagellar motor switch protein FliG